jgi:hypothetical protein
MTPSEDLDTMTTLEAVERSRDCLTLNDRHVGEIREALAIAAIMLRFIDQDEPFVWVNGTTLIVDGNVEVSQDEAAIIERGYMDGRRAPTESETP